MRMNRLSAAVVAAVAGTLILTVPSGARALDAAQSAVVSSTAAGYTPNVNDGIVYAIGQSGSTVVIGGSFTSISPHGSSTTISVDELAAFTAGTGALVTGFKPTLNGTVNTVIAGPTAGTVYVGGSFTTIDGVTSRVALISTTTGAIVPGWTSPAVNGEVHTLVLANGQLFVGGDFTAVAKTSRVSLAVLNPTTGALSSYAVPAFTGHHNYGRQCDPTTTQCSDAHAGIRAMDINPANNRLIAVGNFVTVGGVARDQIALLDLGTSAATLDSSWSTDAYTSACNVILVDSYMRDVQFSPDGSYFVVVTTGAGAGVGIPNSDGTQSTCDAAARFDTSSTGTDIRPTWIDYTGNDTFLSVAITGTAVYVGGHERWVNNTTGHDAPGEGAVPRPGIAALDPVNGMPLTWNPGRNPRGAGAYALLATSTGLYVGSDTDYIGDFQFLHRKIAFFPLAGGKTLASNATGSLPGKVFLLGSGTSTSTARSVQWNGSSAPGTPSTLTAVNWSTARGAFMVNNTVYYGDTDGNFYERSFDGTNFGAAVAIDPYDDPFWDNVNTGSGQTYRGLKSKFYSEMSSLTSMFYSAGRVYYTLSGKSGLFWRWFEPDSGVMGADEFTAAGGQNFSHVSGAFLSGSTLYFADSSSKSLFLVPFVNGQPSGTPSVVNSAIDWTSHGAFVWPSSPNQPTAAFAVSCTLLACSFNAGSSSDPAGVITNYAWTWGDGSSEQHATPIASHTYAAGGTYEVTMTVTDNHGATNSTTQTIHPSATVATPISFGGVSTYDGSLKTATMKVPASTKAGDELLLFESYASSSATASAPAGWSLVGTQAGSNFKTAVYARSALASDAGSTLSVTFSAAVKASLTIGDYVSADGGVEMEASASDAGTASHRSPTLTGLSSGTMAVTFWTDKSTGTTAWTAPASVVKRSAVFGTGGGAVSAMLADSGSAVSGTYGGLTATTNKASGTGIEWTIALATD
jgi:PKD domain